MRVTKEILEGKVRYLARVIPLKEGEQLRLEGYNPGDGARYNISHVDKDFRQIRQLPHAGSRKSSDFLTFLEGLEEGIELGEKFFKREPKKIMLVYQAGIANVFEVEKFNLSPFDRAAMCLLQDSFKTCEEYCRGRHDAGDVVRVAGCNKAGDVSEQHWTQDMDSLPFHNEFEYKKDWLK